MDKRSAIDVLIDQWESFEPDEIVTPEMVNYILQDLRDQKKNLLETGDFASETE